MKLISQVLFASFILFCVSLMGTSAFASTSHKRRHRTVHKRAYSHSSSSNYSTPAAAQVASYSPTISYTPSGNSHACSASDDARTCMICNCMFEAGGESLEGKVAVDIVVIARSNSQKFPSNYCGVIYQKSQFSWTRDSRANVIDTRTKSYRDCSDAADYTMQTKSTVTNPINYYANSGANKIARPSWATSPLAPCPGGQVGNHIFYCDTSISIIPTFAGWVGGIDSWLDQKSKQAVAAQAPPLRFPSVPSSWQSIPSPFSTNGSKQ